MKNLITLLLLTLIGNVMHAQQNVIDRYLAAYDQDESFTKLNVAEKTFDLFTAIETKDVQEQQLIASIKKLKGIKGLFKEKTAEGLAIFKESALKIKANKEYEELVSFSNPEHQGIFMLREQESVIQELMVMFASPEEFGVVTIFGEIDIKRIKDLATVIEKNGQAWFDIFENIATEEIVFGGDSGNGFAAKKQAITKIGELELSVYPNPAVDHVMLAAVKGGGQQYELSFYSLIGEPIRNVGKVDLPYRLALEDVPAGAYFVRITDEAGAFKNFKIVKQ